MSHALGRTVGRAVGRKANSESYHKIFLTLSSQMMTSLFCSLALISAVVFKTDGYPNGAPVTVADFPELCDNMTPLHAPPGSPLPVSQPAEDLPYMIIASSNTYAPGKEIQVHVISKTDECKPLKGVLMQVRTVADTAANHGVFDVMGHSKLMTTECFGNVNSVVTQNDRLSDTNLTLTWTAPGDDQGALEIKATLLYDKVTFWTEVTSGQLTFDPDTDGPPTAVVPDVLCGAAPGCEDNSDECPDDESNSAGGRLLDGLLFCVVTILSVFTYIL